ncbi:hypothetical protein Nizo2741_2518 [Lactiplantibacillus plantarum]|nr:hypothetical protein Nizo2741_2518 [Lactiplantibacillus plantarum]
MNVRTAATFLVVLIHQLKNIQPYDQISTVHGHTDCIEPT